MTIGLFILCLMTCGVWTLSLRERCHALRWTAVTVATVFLEYTVLSAPLFLADCFTIRRALLLALAVNAVLAIIVMARTGRRPRLSAVDMDMRGHVIPIALAVVALLLSGNHFGFFGMGQDEGVYQTRAIDLMNGRSKRVYELDEINHMQTRAQAQGYLEDAWATLGGLYSINSHWSREETLKVPSVFLRDITAEANADKAVYHSLPTYPALLALFGELGGSYAHMMDAQTVLYMLCVLMLWFISENLGLRRWTSAFVCLVFLLSPQVIWLSKSALTEMTQALILCLFMLLLTEPDYTYRRWCSAFAVIAFAFIHVSVYVMFPLFVGLYILLYLLSGERQYLLASAVSTAGYLLGMIFMTVISSFYVVMNLLPLAMGPLTRGTAWYLAIGMGVAGLLVSACALVFRSPKRFRRFLDSRGFGWVYRAVVAALPLWAVFNLVRSVKDAGFNAALTTNGLYVFIWLTGVVSIPVSIAWLLKRGPRALKREPVAVIVCMFLYAVLLMTSFFKPHIAYAYYYSRYLGPYIPVACVMAGLAVNRLSARSVCAGIALSAVAMLPFDHVLLTRLDDTYCSFDTLDRVMDAMSGEGSAVVFSRDNPECRRAFFLPLRSTGAHCYLQEEDTPAQCSALADDYERVFMIGNGFEGSFPTRWVYTRLQENAFLDDNVSNRLPLCPLPVGFNVYSQEITIYRYLDKQVFISEKLYTTGKLEGNRIVLEPEQIQYGPYISLSAGAYEVEVLGDRLSDAAFSITKNVGAQKLPFEVVEQADDHAILRFDLPVDAGNVEFLTINNGEGTVCVDRIVLNNKAIMK